MKQLLMSSVAMGALLLGAASVSAQTTTPTETTLVVNSIQASSGITVDTKAGDSCADGIDALRAENLRSQTVTVVQDQLVITATKPGKGRGAAVLVCEFGTPPTDGSTGGSTDGSTGGSTGGSTDGSTGGPRMGPRAGPRTGPRTCPRAGPRTANRAALSRKGPRVGNNP